MSQYDYVDFAYNISEQFRHEWDTAFEIFKNSESKRAIRIATKIEQK